MLRGIQPKFNESWEVIVDAANSNRADSRTWIGLAILNAADPNDWVGLQIEGGANRTDINSDFATNGLEPAEVVKRISTTKASLKVTFSSVTKVITLWYRISPAAAWTKHATFSTTNGAGAIRVVVTGINTTTDGKGIILLPWADAARTTAITAGSAIAAWDCGPDTTLNGGVDISKFLPGSCRQATTAGGFATGT